MTANPAVLRMTGHRITACGSMVSARRRMSRQSEKFLIGQSRKFLLTALRLKDGANRDEPRGTGQVGVAEASQGWSDQPARGGAADGSDRSLGAQAVEADEAARRSGGGSRPSRTGFQPQNSQQGVRSGDRVVEAAGLARLRTDVRQRATGETARHRGER